ncbi:MAG: hypothetical protein GTN70_10830 [Deltaproteobacteria bacterium]|nr:hypothetical protein [Deltaproteobacteria bacterium]
MDNNYRKGGGAAEKTQVCEENGGQPRRSGTMGRKKIILIQNASHLNPSDEKIKPLFSRCSFVFSSWNVSPPLRVR